jgi:DNA-binding MarR family transcriptional regulator
MGTSNLDESAPVSAEDHRDAICDLPPSAKLVVKALEHRGQLTQRGLAEETLLPTRTVRYALGRLETVGVVNRRISFTDARKRIYTLD